MSLSGWKVVKEMAASVAGGFARAVTGAINLAQMRRGDYAEAEKQKAEEAVRRRVNRTLSDQDAHAILNIEADTPWPEVKKNYAKLFRNNDPKNDGSFYLQSQIYRAMEQIREDRMLSDTEEADMIKEDFFNIEDPVLEGEEEEGGGETEAASEDAEKDTAEEKKE